MYIKNAKVLNKDFRFQKADLMIGDRINYFIPLEDEDDVISGGCVKNPVDSKGNPLPDDSGNLDLCGGMLIPGLVDIHTHGALGMDSMSDDLDFPAWRKYMLANGITTFFPTTVTESENKIEESLERLKDADGVYLEGPYINSANRGAHDEKLIRIIDMELMDKIADRLKIVTLAPEFEENMAAISKLTAKGVKVSLGHSSADYETAKKAFDNGATQLVHTFNAMAPLTHREPNMIGAALDDERVFCEVISDGVHLHPAIVRILSKLLGPKRMLLISDSMSATGLSDGEYILGGLKVIVKDSVARTEYGAIAGSTKNIMQMMRSAVSFGVPLEEAIEMATLTPARATGIDSDVGSIEKGKIANMIWLGDDMEIKAVIYKGEVVRI
ncbi:MAG: N-acetylglucosamine-6-phosphate deacetylase [Saccharofermentanales bacterium]